MHSITPSLLFCLLSCIFLNIYSAATAREKTVRLLKVSLLFPSVALLLLLALTLLGGPLSNVVIFGTLSQLGKPRLQSVSMEELSAAIWGRRRSPLSLQLLLPGSHLAGAATRGATTLFVLQ